VRLELERQRAAQQAAEKERQMREEMARREEEAKKFKDDIEKVVPLSLCLVTC
jgi:hypothetical protein